MNRTASKPTPAEPLGIRVTVAFALLIVSLAAMIALVTWVAVVSMSGRAIELRLLTWGVGVLGGQSLLAVTVSPLLAAWSCRGEKPT